MECRTAPHRSFMIRFFPLLSCLCLAVLMYFTLHNETDLITKKDLDCSDKIKERRNMKLIFVGGMPRSGTTLMRTMLDVHREIRCGLETVVLQDILNQRSFWISNAQLTARLSEAGVYPTALDNAMSEFILEIILGHGPPAKYYCNKDPYTFLYIGYLYKLFPNSRYIMMVRDGRAFAHSVVSRKVQIVGADCTDYRAMISMWNEHIEKMYTECLTVGEDVCMPVKYEQLVLQPQATINRIFDFLQIPCDERVLHHEDFLNETALSNLEYSTSQVVKPLNLNALSSWHGKLPQDVVRDIPAIAPMLKILGYDNSNKVPHYGEPDALVKAKVKKLEEMEKKELETF